MDFVLGLPRTQKGNDVVWIIIDWLTKSTHFLLVNMKYSLEKLSKLYLDEIVRLYRVPMSIVSERDLRFVSRFWQKLQETLETKLNFSTTYYPPIDGQSERTIQTFEDMLRSCIMDFGESWGRTWPWLSLHITIAIIHPFKWLRTKLSMEESADHRFIGMK